MAMASGLSSETGCGRAADASLIGAAEDARPLSP
jgi:hypothetical protein